MQKQCKSKTEKYQAKNLEFSDVLEQIVREGARQMLQTAIEMEVEEYITHYQGDTDENDCRIVVRNGWMPERYILTSLGGLHIRQPRVDDRKLRQKCSEAGFCSSILP